jgi:hypothetical protein
MEGDQGFGARGVNRDRPERDQKQGGQQRHPLLGAPTEDERTRRESHQLEDLIDDDVEESTGAQGQAAVP